MNVLDLFSGIGGFSIGLERAGFNTVAFCEIEPFCQQVLQKHWPGVPIHSDIRELDGEQYRGTVDVVCGGFPCQPFSVAGKQRGSDDDRALWPEMLRVIREVQPAWIIGENVSGFIHMELDNCLSDLEELGYACQTFVIPACAVDAPHRRDRVWVIANTRSEQYESSCPSQQRAPSAKLSGHSHSHSHSQPVSAIDDETSELSISVTDTDSERRRAEQVSLSKREDKTEPGDDGKKGVAANARGERLEGLGLGLGTEPKHAAFGGSCRWPTEPGMDRVANGVPRRVDRLRALGNAVVPQIPEIIGRAILECNAQS